MTWNVLQISPLPCHHWFWLPTTANRKQIKPQKEQYTQLQHPLLQDTIQIYVILPPDHTRMEQPAPGNSGSKVPGLFQVQACCPHVTTTDHPLPFPLPLFVMSTTHLLCHTPFHYISEVSTATSTNQHNHHNIDVGWSIEEEEEWNQNLLDISCVTPPCEFVLTLLYTVCVHVHWWQSSLLSSCVLLCPQYVIRYSG